MIRHAFLFGGNFHLLTLRPLLCLSLFFSSTLVIKTFTRVSPTFHLSYSIPHKFACPSQHTFARTTNFPNTTQRSNLHREMAENEHLEWQGENLNQLVQRIVDHTQCSEEEAANRLQTMIQALLEGPQNPPQERTPPASPPPQPPTQKKIIFIDFDLDATVSDRIPHNPSQYAVGRIESMEYVELWYFTTEGCKEASKATPTAADDTFGLLNTDSGLTLQSIKATKASRNAVADEHLTWEQVMTARHTLIQTANQVNWPRKHTLVLAEFYIKLEGLKAEGYNSRTLLLYHAVVRRQWHETMKGRGTPFNPSIINEALFTKLENQIRDRDQEELLKKASNSCFVSLSSTKLTNKT